MTFKLREPQQKAIDDLAKGIMRGHKRQVLMSATGTGKTTIAAEIAKRAIAKNKRVWFTVDTLELTDQAYEAFTRVGLDVSIIQGIHELTDYRKSVQVITNQTLARRWNVFDRHPEWLPDIVFHDECDVQYKAHHQIANMLPKVPVVGLSATPFSNGLGKLYSNLVIGELTSDAIEAGHLCDFDCYAPYTPEMKGVKTQNGDYNPKQSVLRVDKKEILSDIVNHWKAKAEGRPTLVFAVNIAHSEHICEQFLSAGVNAVHLDGYTDKEKRREIIERFKRGEIDVLCSVMVLTKGFDAPIASCICICAPSKSLRKHIQCIGRVLRTHADKDKALILDFAGNIQRLGFPTDELPQYLDNGDKEERKKRKEAEKKEKLPHPCPRCKHLHTSFACPACGFVPEKQHGIEEVDGVLKKVERKVDMKTKEKWLSMLYGYARIKGYKDGWADHKYREKFKVWPHKKSNVHPLKPDGDVLNYIKHLNIKYAKRA